MIEFIVRPQDKFVTCPKKLEQAESLLDEKAWTGSKLVLRSNIQVPQQCPLCEIGMLSENADKTSLVRKASQ